MDRAVDAAACLDATEARFLRLLNAYRAANGAGRLVAVESLNRAAFLHSRDMGTRNYYSHASKDGRTPWARMKQQGYAGGYLAEIIYASPATADAALAGWKASPRHRAILVEKRVRVIGIGFATVPGSKWTHYWTADFGDAPGRAPRCPR